MWITERPPDLLSAEQSSIILVAMPSFHAVGTLGRLVLVAGMYLSAFPAVLSLPDCNPSAASL